MTRFVGVPGCVARLVRLVLACAFAIAASVVAAKAQPKTTPQRRVSPDWYKRAPTDVRVALKRRGCELPQARFAAGRRNVVSGRFSDARQPDWAAICIASDGSLRVVIFWGNAPSCPAEITSGVELEQRLPPGEAGTLYLAAASPRQILEYRKVFGDVQNNPVTHYGIEVGDEHASVIYYCYRGRWLELQGAD